MSDRVQEIRRNDYAKKPEVGVWKRSPARLASQNNHHEHQLEQDLAGPDSASSRSSFRTDGPARDARRSTRVRRRKRASSSLLIPPNFEDITDFGAIWSVGPSGPGPSHSPARRSRPLGTPPSFTPAPRKSLRRPIQFPSRQKGTQGKRTETSRRGKARRQEGIHQLRRRRRLISQAATEASSVSRCLHAKTFNKKRPQ